MLKPRILPEDIEGLKFIEYRKSFIKELRRMKSACSEPGQTTNFMIMTDWNFPDLPAKDLPLIVIGDFKGNWEKYYKKTARKRSQKDFAFGNASFGKETSEGQEFILEIRHGRIKPKGSRAFDKVILSKVGLFPVVIKRSGTDEETTDAEDGADAENIRNGAVASTITATVGNSAREKKEKFPQKEPSKNKEERIEDIKAQTAELKKATESIKAKFALIKNQVSDRVKTDNLTRKDLIAVRELHKAYMSYNDAFDSADPKLQEKFASAKKALDNQNKEFAKFALLVKAKKKTLAEQLADKFFEKNADREANKEEVEQMQKSLKAAINYRQISMREGNEKQLNLKAIYISAQMKGPAFKSTHTDRVYEKLMQPK
jgi:hypothetical protein